MMADDYTFYAPRVCPTCGRCPTCGQNNYGFGTLPYYPYQGTNTGDPVPANPTITCSHTDAPDGVARQDQSVR